MKKSIHLVAVSLTQARDPDHIPDEELIAQEFGSNQEYYDAIEGNKLGGHRRLSKVMSFPSALVDQSLFCDSITERCHFL